MWNKESSNKYCENNVDERSANTQIGCQALCKAKSESECVGIAYSHKIGSTDHCYLCKDDTLRSAYNDFGFYRRPGIFKIFSIWLINRIILSQLYGYQNGMIVILFQDDILSLTLF